MHLRPNPHRRIGLDCPELRDVPFPSTDAAAPSALLTRCPAAAQTLLVDAVTLADELGISRLWIKDERARMGLGSFKALGAAYVIACDHAAGQSEGQTYVTASAGNHGLSVAVGAAAFGARSVVYLAAPVPESFAERLRSIGAEVVRAGDDYEASMKAAAKAADDTGAILLSDSSWPGYLTRPHRLMEGYTVLMEETFAQIPEPPSHILLQAGVGGLAGAAAAMARKEWGDGPEILVVEPEFAPALSDSIAAGRPAVTSGPISDMGRLDCKEPSLIALKGLARDADQFMTITEAEGAHGADTVARHGMASTPSGAAGLAGLMAMKRSATMRVLVILSEEPES